MELSLLRKSNPLFCPPYRPSSLPRPHIVARFPLFLTSCLLPHDFQSSLSPTTLPLKQQYHMLPLQPCHLMPPSTNPPLLLTISFHFMPHVCLVSSNPSYTSHNASPSSLIALSHSVSPYPSFISLSTLTLSYPSTSHRLTLSFFFHVRHFSISNSHRQTLQTLISSPNHIPISHPISKPIPN